MSSVLARDAKSQPPSHRSLVLRRQMVPASQHAELAAAVNVAKAASDCIDTRLDNLVYFFAEESAGPPALVGSANELAAQEMVLVFNSVYLNEEIEHQVAKEGSNNG